MRRTLRFSGAFLAGAFLLFLAALPAQAAPSGTGAKSSHTAKILAAATHHPGARPAISEGLPCDIEPTSLPCSDIRMSYFGGPVISGPQVEDVFWGSSGTYGSDAGPGGAMPAFFNAVGSSNWWGWLTEYDTNDITGGTGQVIGPASSLGETTITPAAGNDGTTITDGEMQAQLQASLTAGTLPAPTLDSEGYAETDYALFFPDVAGQKLEGPPGTGQGGVAWCSYHSTTTWDGIAIPYLVLPAFVTGTLYATECGDDTDAEATLFDQFTSDVSHELVESATDPDVGLDTADDYADPAAWADNSHDVGEVADACDVTGNTATVAGYVVQDLWSNIADACISSRPYGDVSPTSATIPAQATQTYTASGENGDETADTTFTITTSEGGPAPEASCTANVCTVSQAGDYLVTGTDGSIPFDEVPLTVTADSDPGAPTIGTATAGNASASVAFAPPASDGGAPILHYTVTAADSTNAGRGGQTDTGAGSPIAVSGLTNGDTYTFSVTATNVAGTGSSSQPSNAVKPVPAPTIKSLKPAKGKVGKKVTIKGTNLAGAIGVSFHGVVAIITKDTATEIVTKVPAGATTGFVTVATAGGTATSTKSFKVT